MTDGIKKHNDAYVDNADTHERAMENDTYMADNFISQLGTGAQKCANLCNVIAQSIVFQEFTVKFLSFTNLNSSLKTDHKIQYEMSLEDSKGAESSIKYLPPDKPNNGLECCHALDRNQTYNF